MKIRNVLSIVLVLSMLALLLVSCGDKTVMDTLYDSKWEYPTQTLTSHKTYEVKGSLADVNDRLALLSDVADTAPVTRVFNHRTGVEIKGFTDTAALTHKVVLLDSSRDNAFLVLSLDVEKTSYSLRLFDAAGTEVDLIDSKELGLLTELDQILENKLKVEEAFDLIFFGDSVYEEKEDGTLALVTEFVLTSMTSEDLDAKIGDKYYTLEDDYAIVYNNVFSPIYRYDLPSYAENSEVFVLESGNLLVQYMTELPDDASDYDLYQGYSKYSLTTLIIDISDGSQKDAKTNALIDSVTPYTDSATGVFGGAVDESVKNVATVSYINKDTKTVDNAQMNMDYVVLGNDGSIKNSLRISHEFMTPPIPIAQNVYVAQSIYGQMVFFNEKSEETLRFESGKLDFTGAYVYNDKTVYDLCGNVIYDLAANNARVEGAVGKHLVITTETTVENEAVRTYSILKGGVLSTLCVIGGQSADAQDFVRMGEYYVIQNKDGEYSYFNVDGTLLVKTAKSLTTVTYVPDGILLIDSDGILQKFVYDKILED